MFATLIIVMIMYLPFHRANLLKVFANKFTRDIILSLRSSFVDKTFFDIIGDDATKMGEDVYEQ